MFATLPCFFVLFSPTNASPGQNSQVSFWSFPILLLVRPELGTCSTRFFSRPPQSALPCLSFDSDLLRFAQSRPPWLLLRTGWVLACRSHGPLVPIFTFLALLATVAGRVMHHDLLAKCLGGFKHGPLIRAVPFLEFRLTS